MEIKSALIYTTLLVALGSPLTALAATAEKQDSERAMLARPQGYIQQSNRREALKHTTMADVQRVLKSMGMRGVEVNGIYDQATQRRLIEFQRRHDLPVTGKADPDTMRELGINPWGKNQ